MWIQNGEGAISGERRGPLSRELSGARIYCIFSMIYRRSQARLDVYQWFSVAALNAIAGLGNRGGPASI